MAAMIMMMAMTLMMFSSDKRLMPAMSEAQWVLLSSDDAGATIAAEKEAGREGATGRACRPRRARSYGKDKRQ